MQCAVDESWQGECGGGCDNDQDLVDEEAFHHEWDMKGEVNRTHFT